MEYLKEKTRKNEEISLTLKVYQFLIHFFYEKIEKESVSYHFCYNENK